MRADKLSCLLVRPLQSNLNLFDIQSYLHVFAIKDIKASTAAKYDQQEMLDIIERAEVANANGDISKVGIPTKMQLHRSTWHPLFEQCQDFIEARIGKLQTIWNHTSRMMPHEHLQEMFNLKIHLKSRVFLYGLLLDPDWPPIGPHSLCMSISFQSWSSRCDNC